VGGQLLDQHQQRHQAQLLRGREIVTVAHLDRTMGYIPQNNRHYVGNKEVNMMIGELPAAGVRE